MSNANANLVEEIIPSELVRLYETFQLRISREKALVNKLKEEISRDLDGLRKKAKEARRKLDDHMDSLREKYRADPEKIPLERQDPSEVKESRTLLRKTEDLEEQIQIKSRELTEKLRSSQEAKTMQETQRECEEWLVNVCRHFKCASSNLNWKAHKITKFEVPEGEIPTDLLEISNN